MRSVKVKVARRSLVVRLLYNPWGKIFFFATIILVGIGLSVFSFYYVKYSRLIDSKLSTGPFANTSKLFAAPRMVMVGDEGSPSEIAVWLRRSGYGESKNTRMGWYQIRPDAIDIYPGPDAFDQDSGVIKFEGPKVSKIIALRDSSERTRFALEPELITNLFDRNREKRRIVKFADIPEVLQRAVISAEDKRFFQHSGFDPVRIVKAAYVDVRDRRYGQGASTLSQQLARSFWLDQEKTWRRKAAEVMITLELERKLTKNEIFEYYSNEVYLGRRGSFSIHGFGEGAQAYFGKDLRNITLEEASLMAGLIQRPSYTNPFRYPDRAKSRRNIILSMMKENQFINQEQYETAAAAPVKLAGEEMESSDAPYFVDLVNESLVSQFQDHDFQNSSYRVYTTLDMDLQRDALQAVHAGMLEVDAQLKKRHKDYGGAWPEAQVALVAMDPQTGQIKALIGGRNYGLSQLDRAQAKRQPGSVFKPFVYTAAMNTALTDGSSAITPLTTYVDEPTTFWYDNKAYEPNNFEGKFNGTVTVRQALAKSLNIPTVKIAEAVGYRKVVDLARRAGLNMDIRATPAVALGAYEVTPIEVAGAYTMFPGRGVRSKPSYISLIRDQSGSPIFEEKPDRKTVVDARVAYLMVNMMEEVLRSGTGAGVRYRYNFTLPAAGKTGTSHDGWFAGFTSKLICVVWVGYDDNRELKLEGAKSALPIWGEFMKRAHKHPEYRNVSAFYPPDGIVTAQVDPQSGQLATTACPEARSEVFIAGTQPVEVCRLHGGGGTQIAGWEPSQSTRPVSAPGGMTPASGKPGDPRAVQSIPVNPSQPPNQQPKPAEGKGIFGRIRDIFK